MIAWLAVALAAPVALDAGPVAAPVLEGFDALNRQDSSDARVRWQTPPIGARWDRGPDPLAADGLAAGTLHLALEPGPWLLWVMLGQEVPMRGAPVGRAYGVRVDGAAGWEVQPPQGWDWFDSAAYAPPFARFVAGETEWDRVVAPRHRWQPMEVEVGDDGLLLSPFGWPLQGLVAVPAAARAQGEALVAEADALRRERFHREHAPGAVVLEPPASEGPLRVLAGTWRDPPDPTAQPVVAMALEVALGERVGRVVWLGPGDEAARWSWQGPLAPDGAEVHWLDAWGTPSRRRIPRPSFLRPTERGELRGEQGMPVGLALTWTVPEHAAPGTRKGTLVVRRGRDKVQVEVTLRVRDLRLDPAPVPSGVFYDARPEVADVFGSLSPEHRAAVARDFGHMRASGLERVAMRFAVQRPGLAATDAADAEVFGALSTEWRAQGARRHSRPARRRRPPRLRRGGAQAPRLPGPWGAGGRRPARRLPGGSALGRGAGGAGSIGRAPRR